MSEEKRLPYRSQTRITLDSVRQEARLPQDKLQKCRAMLQNFQARRSVGLKELQSLIGLLNFTCLMVVPGRAFLRRMIDLTSRSRARWYEHGQKNSEYFLNLEKLNHRRKHIIIFD